MMIISTDIPTPPARLYNDKRVLNRAEAPSCWENRRANKMRERYPVMNATTGALLVAPVQPSVRAPHSLGVPF